MRENMEQRAVEDRLDRIESQLRQITIALIALLIMSPLGLFCLATFADALSVLGAFWVAIALSVGGVLVLCIGVRKTRGRRMRQLELDLLEKALKDHQQREDGTPA